MGCWTRGIIRSRWSIAINRVRSRWGGGDRVRSVVGLIHSLIVTHYLLILLLIPPPIPLPALPPLLTSQSTHSTTAPHNKHSPHPLPQYPSP